MGQDVREGEAPSWWGRLLERLQLLAYGWPALLRVCGTSRGTLRTIREQGGQNSPTPYHSSTRARPAGWLPSVPPDSRSAQFTFLPSPQAVYNLLPDVLLTYRSTPPLLLQAGYSVCLLSEQISHAPCPQTPPPPPPK